MNPIQRLFPDMTSTVVGVLFIVIGVYLLILTTQITAGFGALFIGIFTLMVMTGKTVDKKVAESAMTADADTLDEVLEDLGIEGDLVQVPSSDILSTPRTYVPVSEFKGLPPLQDEMVIVTSGGGRVGLSLVPPGLHLMERGEEHLEERAEGMEGAREIMGVLTHGLGLAKSFSIRREEGVTKLRITHGNYKDYCDSLRKDRKDICTRTACPLCSAYLTSASQYTKTPLRLVGFNIDEDHITYEMEEVG